MTAHMQAPARRDAEVLAALAAMAEPDGRADPYPLYDRLRALGRAVVAPEGALIVTGYRDCSALLRDHRLYKAPERMLAASGYPDWQDRPSLRLRFTSILTLNPPVHTRLRRLVSAAFTARRVEGLRPAVHRIVAEACGQIAGETDFVAGFAFPLPVAVMGELLGIPAADRPMFQGLVRDWLAVLGALEWRNSRAVDRADAAASAIGGYLADLAAHRRVHPADDLISALAAAEAADKLTPDELVTMAALLLGAGFEIPGLLANGLVALLAHPGQAQRLRTEAGLAVPAVEELLRYAVGGRGQGRAAHRRRCGSFRRALRAEALRRAELPRPVAPGDRPRAVPAVSAPVPRPAAKTRPSASRKSRRRREKSQPPGRNAAHCPGRPLHPQGHPKILSDRSAERIFRTRPCARSSGDPAGLTARAGPKARPDRRTANLCNPTLIRRREKTEQGPQGKFTQ